MRYSCLAQFAIILSLAGISRVSANPISPLICGNSGSTHAGSADTTIHADSCTDFSYQYVNPQPTQGVNNWLYGYYAQDNLTPSGFQLLTPLEADPSDPQNKFWAMDFWRSWTSLDAFGGHPNGGTATINTDLHDAPFCTGPPPAGNCGSGPDPNRTAPTQWAVRRYVVPGGFNGLVNITFAAQKDYRTPVSDGTLNFVYLLDGTAVTLLATLDAVAPQITGRATTPADEPVEIVKLTNVALHGGEVLDFAIAPKQNDFSDGTFQWEQIESVAPEPATFGLMAAALAIIYALKRARVLRGHRHAVA
jgi:hypothetical protein